jgi:hypothetical protein
MFNWLVLTKVYQCNFIWLCTFFHSLGFRSCHRIKLFWKFVGHFCAIHKTWKMAHKINHALCCYAKYLPFNQYLFVCCNLSCHLVFFKWPFGVHFQICSSHIACCNENVNQTFYSWRVQYSTISKLRPFVTCYHHLMWLLWVFV